jgi:hypothetical protein
MSGQAVGQGMWLVAAAVMMVPISMTVMSLLVSPGCSLGQHRCLGASRPVHHHRPAVPRALRQRLDRRRLPAQGRDHLAGLAVDGVAVGEQV